MNPFDLQLRTRLVFGEGSVARLGEFCQQYGGTRVLVVTDPGIVRAGHAERACEILRAAGAQVSVYGSVRENPTTEDVGRCVEAAREVDADLLVGLGGGSSMDTAKGANFLLTNGGRMQDYWGIGKARLPMLPLIAIPTTSGTGSECQSFALISDPVTHQKMACGDEKASARVSILDPELTVSQPVRVTACTGVDALSHAVETAVTMKRNAVSVLFSREAFKLCIGALPAVLREPGNLRARGEMQLAAAYAGIAIENSMLGCAHSAANPLTAHYQVVHGQAVGRMLPHVVRRNALKSPEAAQGYLEHARAAGMESVAELVERLEAIVREAGLFSTLSELGVSRVKLGELAKEASKQWTAQFNPVEYTGADFEELYLEAF
jgi:alcohol dehydrogenase